MDNADLVRTARSLDQNGPGEHGENLQQLWDCLTSSTASNFHAAEESTLRWLLKSMGGSAESAELFRRYPLTWAILECVMLRIPLFSLAKSLADRKFYAVLQQTLRDISSPAETTTTVRSTKRKRQPSASFSLDDLRRKGGCLQTAQAVFSTLRSLIKRLDDTPTTFSRDKLGAEHIKSLFCTSAMDAAALVTPALALCDTLLESNLQNEVFGAEEWIYDISWLWERHLQSKDDGLTVAVHLFQPAAVILSKLGVSGVSSHASVDGPLKPRWSADLKIFMVRTFALPSRAAFADTKSLETFEQVLAVSSKTSHIAAPAVFYLASHALANTVDGSLRRTNVEWIKATFRAVEAAIAPRTDRNALMTIILEQAVERSVPVDVGDLRRVCREYALQESTDWKLVESIARCDPDVFQLSEDGVALRDEVCRRSRTTQVDDIARASVTSIIVAVREGFRTRRDLPNFLRFWFQQLCEVERLGTCDNSSWFAAAQAGERQTSLSSMIETDLSSQQLGDLINWTRENTTRSCPQALSLFTSTLALAVRSDSFVDVTGRHLFDLVADIKGDASYTTLRWRVISRTASWVLPSERLDIWEATKKRLSKVLAKSPVSSSETYEAFKTCFDIWKAMSPDGEQMEEPAGLIEAFAKRLIDEPDFPEALGSAKILSALELGNGAELQDDLVYQQYLCWYLNGSCRYVTLAAAEDGELPAPLATTISYRKSNTEDLHATLTAVLCNEINLNNIKLSQAMIDRLIATVDEAKADKSWPDDKMKTCMRALASIPLACYDRAQRESLMSILSRKRSAASQASRPYDIETWKLLLSIVAKIMAKPTFPEGMDFRDLVETADMLSTLAVDSGQATMELVWRFCSMASTTIRQMAENIDDRSIAYFLEAATFVETAGNEACQASPLRATLLKALSMELRRSQSALSHTELSSLLRKCEEALVQRISETIDRCISDKGVLEGSKEDMAIFAVTDAAAAVPNTSLALNSKASAVRKFEKFLSQRMQEGDLKAWKTRAMIQAHLQGDTELPRQVVFGEMNKLPAPLRESVIKDLVGSIVRDMRSVTTIAYLKALLDEFKKGCQTDGQLLAIDHVVNQLIDLPDLEAQADGFNLASAQGALAVSLQNGAKPNLTCRIMRTLLEKRPQAMGQWNVEITLNTVSDLASSDDSAVSYSWLCKLVDVIIKKHRLRLEGHFHLLLSALQALLQNLILAQQSSATDGQSQESKAQLFARLITLVCEPTAGAVARSQLHSSLDSATDAAKRSAGRHMYLILVQFVKLQLEASVTVAVREALEPATYSIFSITSPEGRKILNDSVDSSGRAILREMFKRYVKFGKWTGV